jgi:hypothetical protein
LEAVKKMTVLLDKINEDQHHYNNINSPEVTSKNNTNNGYTSTSSSCSSSSSNNHKIKNNNNNVIFQNKNSNNINTNNHNNSNNKRNSVDSTIILPQPDITKTTTITPGTDRDNENHDAKVKLREKSKENLHAPLQHRRSLSENIIQFPPHTTPSDKARCHMLNRTNSKLLIGDDIVGDEDPTCAASNVVTLRKVAETMFLKDPQSRNVKKSKNSKPTNPFTALAQLRGVKKILGANPSTYTAGVGDLFSSCFEMSTPFLKELSKQNRRDNGEIQPKSLPNSPGSLRKDYTNNKIDEKTDLLKDVTQTAVTTAMNSTLNGAVAYECACEEWQHRNNYRQPQFCGTIRKYKANFNDLSSHPLYKNGNLETDETMLQHLQQEDDATLGEVQPISKLSKLNYLFF